MDDEEFTVFVSMQRADTCPRVDSATNMAELRREEEEGRMKGSGVCNN